MLTDFSGTLLGKSLVAMNGTFFALDDELAAIKKQAVNNV